MSKAISLTISDSFGNDCHFETSAQLRSFILAEQREWSWMRGDSNHSRDLLHRFQSHFQAALNWIAQFEEGQSNEGQLGANLAQLYSGSPPTIVFSEFPPGANISLIREAAGAGVAENALALLVGQRSPNLTDLRDFRAWQLLANPNLITADAWLNDQKRRIGAARQALRREIDKYAEATEKLTSDTASANERERRRYRRLAGRALSIGEKRASRVESRAVQQLSELERTRAAYAEQMRLKAPVRYWSLKKRRHEKSARNWAIALGLYLVLAVVLTLQALSGVWSEITPGEAFSGRHFLLVTGVGALLTLVFWMARLIVRIYLGERHLATDAEERRTMTQAYLALIKESAASDQERVVILSALFRAAQDGIVKDDGAGDISLPAMVARLIEARR